MKFLITRRKCCCWFMLAFIFVQLLASGDAQQSPGVGRGLQPPPFQQGGMPAGLMAGVQDCPTNILFSIVATCTSIQSQLPTLVERLRDAIRIQEDPNDFSPSDIAKMRETSTGLCEMADPMLSCLSLLGKCPSLLGSLGGGVEDARGVLQIMCVNRSLDRYLDCTERNGGMNIRQRYCSQYRNYTSLEQNAPPPPSRNGESIRSTISSLASFQGFGNMLNEGTNAGVLTDRESAAMNGIAGLMGGSGSKTTINCPLFTLFSGCMASAVKKVCGQPESESMYYVSQIQAKTGSEACQLPATADDAERQYLKHLYMLQGTTLRPTQPAPGVTVPNGIAAGGTRTPRVRPSRRTTTPNYFSSPSRQTAGDHRPQHETTAFWMPNRLRTSPPPRQPSNKNNENDESGDSENVPWWYNAKEAATTPQNNGNNNNNNVIVLQLATTPSRSSSVDNSKISSELRQNAFDWSDDDDATYGSRRGENSAISQLSRTWHGMVFAIFLQIALSALVYTL